MTDYRTKTMHERVDIVKAGYRRWRVLWDDEEIAESTTRASAQSTAIFVSRFFRKWQALPPDFRPEESVSDVSQIK